MHNYALIFWLDEKKSDVIETVKIPKRGRTINKVSLLTWEDCGTKMKLKRRAKVLALSSNKQDLDKMRTGPDGNIAEFDAKLMSYEILEDKRQTASTKKLAKNASMEAHRKLAKEILERRRMMDTALNKSSTPAPKKVEGSFISPSISRMDASSSDEPDEIHRTLASHKPSHTEQQSVGNQMKSIHLVFPGGITKRDIQIQRMICEAMEIGNAEGAEKVSISFMETTNDANFCEIPSQFTTPGPNKVQIMENSGIYFYDLKKKSIEDKAINSYEANGEVNWQEMVKKAMGEIFGDHLKDFSAKGSRRTSRPKIPTMVFDGVYYWAKKICDEYGTPIDWGSYVKLVNDTAANKRKTLRLRGKGTSTSLPISE